MVHQGQPTYASQDGNYLLYSSSGPGVGQGWWLGNAADGTASAAALAFLPRGHVEWWVLDGGAPREARVVITTALHSSQDASSMDSEQRNQTPDSSAASTSSKAVLRRLEEPGGEHFQLTGHLPGKGRIPAWMQVYSNASCELDQYASQDGSYLLYRSSGPGVGQGWWLGRALDGTASEAALAFLPRGHADWWVLDDGNPQQAQVVISTASPSADGASGIEQKAPKSAQKPGAFWAYFGGRGASLSEQQKPVAAQSSPTPKPDATAQCPLVAPACVSRKTPAAAKAMTATRSRASQGTSSEVQPPAAKAPRTKKGKGKGNAIVPVVNLEAPLSTDSKVSADSTPPTAATSSATATTQTVAAARIAGAEPPVCTPSDSIDRPARPINRSPSPNKARSVTDDASDSIDRIARAVIIERSTGGGHDRATLSSSSASSDKALGCLDTGGVAQQDKVGQISPLTGIVKKRVSYNDLHCGIMAHQEKGRQQARTQGMSAGGDHQLGPGLFPTPVCPEAGMLPRGSLQSLGPRMGVMAKELQLCITPSEGCFLKPDELKLQDKLLRSFQKLTMKFESATIHFQPVQLVVPL